MNDILVCILGGLILSGITGAVGWYLGRKSAPAPDADGRLEQELRNQVSGLRGELQRANDARLAAEKQQSAAEAQVVAATESASEQRRQSQEQFALYKDEQERALRQMRDAFSSLSAEALAKLQPQFLSLANETLAKHAETARGDLAQRQESIATLLKPMEGMLRTYQERLQQSENAQSTAIGEVTRHLATLTLQSANLSGETVQLRKVLGSSQARGRWGEETLRRVVEASGMSTHVDFTEQAVKDDSRPDMIVNLPGNRAIIIDSKVPELDFLTALHESDEVKRAAALRAHADKLKGTIKALADRDYPRQFPNALDHIVLFLPAESLFSAALEGDRDLILWAGQKRILLATPATLIGLLRAVSISWQQHDQAANAREIVTAAEELYSRVATFSKHFDAIRDGLSKANDAYNSAVGSYERQVRPQGERILKLGAGSSGKALPEAVPLIDSLRAAPRS